VRGAWVWRRRTRAFIHSVLPSDKRSGKKKSDKRSGKHTTAAIFRPEAKMTTFEVFQREAKPLQSSLADSVYAVSGPHTTDAAVDINEVIRFLVCFLLPFVLSYFRSPS